MGYVVVNFQVNSIRFRRLSRAGGGRNSIADDFCVRGCAWKGANASEGTDEGPRNESFFRMQQQQQQQRVSDGLFRHIASQHTSITGLLDSFFGFLKRHTDFYLLSGGDGVGPANVGFPPGQAELLTLAAFRKYALADARGASVAADGSAATDAAAHLPASRIALSASGAASAVERAGVGGGGGGSQRKASQPTGASVLELMRANLRLSTRKGSRGGDGGGGSSGGDGDGGGDGSQDLQTPVNNGGVTEWYWWEQSLSTVCLHIPVPYVRTPTTLMYV